MRSGNYNLQPIRHTLLYKVYSRHYRPSTFPLD